MFIAKLIAPDGFEDKKQFETQASAHKWAMGEGLKNFDGDVERVEIHHDKDGLTWFKDRPKMEEDWRFKQMRADPDPRLWLLGWPRSLREKLK
jgi:hypothetical protein